MKSTKRKPSQEEYTNAKEILVRLSGYEWFYCLNKDTLQSRALTKDETEASIKILRSKDVKCQYSLIPVYVLKLLRNRKKQVHLKKFGL